MNFDQINTVPSIQRWLKNHHYKTLTSEIFIHSYDQAISLVAGRVKFIKESELEKISEIDPLAKDLFDRKSRSCVNWLNPANQHGYIYCLTERWNDEISKDQGVLGLHEVLGVVGLETDIIDEQAPRGMDSHYSNYPISSNIWKYSGEKTETIKEFAMFDVPMSTNTSTDGRIYFEDGFSCRTATGYIRSAKDNVTYDAGYLYGLQASGKPNNDPMVVSAQGDLDLARSDLAYFQSAYLKCPGEHLEN